MSDEAIRCTHVCNGGLRCLLDIHADGPHVIQTNTGGSTQCGHYPTVCRHGGLRRKCEPCDLEEELRDARARLSQAERLLREACRRLETITDPCLACDEDIHGAACTCTDLPHDMQEAAEWLKKTADERAALLAPEKP